MKVEYWCYSGVKRDGTFVGDPDHHQGKVHTQPRLDTSGGHHLPTPSTKAAGLWMSVSTGRLADGTVHGITLFFRDEAEMQQFEQTQKGNQLSGER